MTGWQLRLRGGAYDGGVVPTDEEPCPVLIAWRCNSACEGHVTFDPADPDIMLRTAEAYRRVEIDPERRVAVYETGDGAPGVREEEDVLVGASGGVEFVGGAL